MKCVESFVCGAVLLLMLCALVRPSHRCYGNCVLLFCHQDGSTCAGERDFQHGEHAGITN